MWKKRIGFGVLTLLAAAGTAFGYLYFRSPATAPPANVRVEASPERLARGKYLFEVVLDCDGCHSVRDFTRYGGPIVPGKRGQGQEMPFRDLPGKIVASNITSDPESGIGAWTDGEKIRAIREGIGRDGRVLFPMMPYGSYREMSDEDTYALVAFLNTLAPVKNLLPKSQIDFPASMFIKGAPQPAGRVAAEDPANRLLYGRYLVTIAGCQDCHTPAEQGKPDNSRKFAGGRKFESPMGTVISSNLSPDKATGIGDWDFTRFRDRFRAYAPLVENGSPSVLADKFTVMPWLGFSRLTDSDLEAIYTYLRTRTAMPNKVEAHPKP